MNECREEVYTAVISLQFYIVFYNQLRLINMSESILFVRQVSVKNRSVRTAL